MNTSQSSSYNAQNGEVMKHVTVITPDSDTDGERSADESTYGMELVMDLHDCDPETFTRDAIEQYFSDLCKLIDMEPCELHFWDDRDVPEEERQTNPKTKGTSAVQFILTSSIVIHTLDLLRAVYLNIFSCKRFDADAAARFSAEAFCSRDWNARVLRRL